MKKYKIKEAAVPFIKEKYATGVYSFDVWDANGIDMNALEEVFPIYITHGKKTGETSSTLSGWDKDGGTFEFTIHFPGIAYGEWDKFNNGRTTRELMDRLQRETDRFFEQFLCGDNK